ncbi:MAG: Purine nucleoside phosphorylase DeoD-type [Phycisphaerae bacterium]|nr:Purine nucleoside phosphorylase DeoD-type [Phycisphaerae bacterium]
MNENEFPILEFDPSPEALIEPSRLLARADVPEHCVLCFFREVIGKFAAEPGARVVAEVRSEAGVEPVYEIDYGDRRLGFAHPGIGAPFAGGMLEELIARGFGKFIACGGCGVLRRDVVVGHVVLPTSAVRDEGTSYHYLPPSREVQPDPAALSALRATLEARGVPHLEGKTWTTDGFYRETPAKVARRREEGCLTVEMEASAFFAVARFRGVQFAQLLYAGDDLSGPQWNSRRWHSRAEIREQLFRLSAEACLSL